VLAHLHGWVFTLTYFRAGDVLDFQGAAQGTQGGINSLKDGMDFGPKGEDGDSCAYEGAVHGIGGVAVTVTCGMKSAGESSRAHAAAAAALLMMMMICCSFQLTFTSKFASSITFNYVFASRELPE
jgi:hypothetical protein